MSRSERGAAEYRSLTARQKEAYNFEQVSEVLSDHGYDCDWLPDKRDNADFLARHQSGGNEKRVQLMSRCLIDKKYENQELWVAFPVDDAWYFLEHDRLRDLMDENTGALKTKSWIQGNRYSWPTPPSELLKAIHLYRLD